MKTMLRKVFAMLFLLLLACCAAPSAFAEVTGIEVADYAINNLQGKPYGGNYDYGPDRFQCNGLVWYAYNHFGIDITRGIDTQPNQGIEVTYSLNSYNDFINNLLPGDLIFFYYPSSAPRNYPHHVAIYVDNGEVVQAQQPGSNSVKSPLTWTWAEGKQEWQLTCSVRRILSPLKDIKEFGYVKLMVSSINTDVYSQPCGTKISSIGAGTVFEIKAYGIDYQNATWYETVNGNWIKASSQLMLYYVEDGKCEAVAGPGLITVFENSDVYSLPCNSNTDSHSQVIGSIGMPDMCVNIHTNGILTNSAGNYWYEIDYGGRPGYIWSPHALYVAHGTASRSSYYASNARLHKEPYEDSETTKLITWLPWSSRKINMGIGLTQQGTRYSNSP